MNPARSMDVASVTDKLTKLIAMEQSARTIGNLQEAEAFAAKVQEMLFKYNLSMTDLEIEEQERDEPIDEERIDILKTRQRSQWQEMLAEATAASCFCRSYVILGSSRQVFAGRTSDRQAAIALFGYLAASGKSICDTEARKARTSNPFGEAAKGRDRYSWQVAERDEWARKWRKSFFIGFALAISTRLTKDRLYLSAQSEASTAMVLRKDVALAAWEKNTTTGQARGLATGGLNRDGYRAGERAGSSINLKAHAALTA